MGLDKKYILAVDHGTSGIKTSIVSTDGRIIDFEFEKTQIYFLPEGGAEQNPDDWWKGVLNTSKKLVAKGLVQPRDIVAVSVSSTFSTTVIVDEAGNHLMNAITWMDSRGAPFVKKLMKGFPSIEGYGLFKIMKWLPKTGGGPTLSGKDDIAHVLLVKNLYPQIYKKAHMFLPSKDFLNMKLTGRFSASFDSIQLFWLTDTRNVNNIHYDDKLIKYSGIDKDKLPPLMASTGVLGELKKDVAELIGLEKNVKVVSGSPDHQTACIGSGAVDDFQGHIYIGTSSWVQCIVPFKKTDAFHSIASFPTSIPGRYQSVNEQDIAGGALSFLLENIIYHNNRLLTGKPIDDPYKYLDEIVAKVPAGSNKLIFTPWLNGERTPVDDPYLRGCLFNISNTTNQDHIIRAVMEGVAFNTRWSMKYVEKFINRKMDSLNIIGGGAKSDIWCRIFADVLNREIRQVESPMQANARGAALIASVGLGYIKFKDIGKYIKYKKIFKPDQENRKIYDDLFHEFLNLYKKNKRIFKRLNRL